MLTATDTQCDTDFCYVCRALYGGPEGVHAIGNSAHLTSCNHYAPLDGEYVSKGQLVAEAAQGADRVERTTDGEEAQTIEGRDPVQNDEPIDALLSNEEIEVVATMEESSRP